MAFDAEAKSLALLELPGWNRLDFSNLLYRSGSGQARSVPLFGRLWYLF